MERQQPPIAPAAAREALNEVGRTSVELGQHMRTPWWYHVGLAAAFGAICASFAFAPKIQAPLFVAGVCAIIVLVRALYSTNGAWVSGMSAPGRPKMIACAMGVVGGLGFAGSTLVKSTDNAWIALVIGAVVFIVLAAGGWAWDAAYRDSLAEAS